MRTAGIFTILTLCATLAAAADEPQVTELECLPNEHNQILTATVSGLGGGDMVRVYFRRVNPSGAFYFLDMQPSGGNEYWAVLPRPEEREQQDLTDEWWEVLEDRDWVAERDRDEIEDYFDEQEYELAEYFVAVVDAAGERVARSDDFVVEVVDEDDCEVELDPIETGYSRNLTVGETVQAQVGEAVFHWLCDGIVTRLGASGILRADDFCRACAVAWFPVATTAGALTTGTTIHFREPRRASDVEPPN
ncbi:MAG: hypothetical protein R3325_07935 [Thermoanaerobaculia bacterium]|nr:hypothetical protein [Thermoanaerobaculia bacterium]